MKGIERKRERDSLYSKKAIDETKMGPGKIFTNENERERIKGRGIERER